MEIDVDGEGEGEREKIDITHLYSHGDVLLADIVIMLVGVQHYDSIGQGKAGIVAHEWTAVHFLWTHK